MAPSFPVQIDNIKIKNIELLYQALALPDQPDIQQQILSQNSPMTAKMIKRQHEHLQRQDWDEIKVKVMDWCIKIKLLSNWESLGSLLLETGDTPLAEYSSKGDKFWGVVRDERKLIGVNALGRLWMGIREEMKKREGKYILEALDIKDLKLMGDSIGSQSFVLMEIK